jgi:small subunit ribosomal protein S16
LHSVFEKRIFYNNYKAKFYFMPVKIRLQRHGRKQRPFYYIVAADGRSKRDGKFIERIGDYNPLTVPATINLDVDKAFEWVMNGAQPTNTVKKILTFKGVLYKKHLQNGVTKGAFSQEVADKKFEEWIEAKKAKVQSRIEKEFEQIEEKRKKRNQAEAEKRTAKLVEAEEALKAQEAAAEAENEATESTEETAEAGEQEAPQADAPQADAPQEGDEAEETKE